ncbi:hypothetical protein SprV_0100345400 [Sparganum proliferum]
MREGYLDAPSVATLALAGLCLGPEVRPARLTDDKGDLVCRRVDQPSYRRLQDADSSTTSGELAQRLANLPVAAATDVTASVENRWCRLRDTVLSTVSAVLGHARRQHEDWFDDTDAAISNPLADKNCLHKAYSNCPIEDDRATFCRSRRLVKQRLRQMQDTWTARRDEEIQEYTDRNEWNNCFATIKAVYGLLNKTADPLLSADGGTLLAEKTQVLQRWSEHFRGVLNHPSTISDAAIARLLQVETNSDLDPLPSLNKTNRVLQLLTIWKSSGSDAIDADLYEHDGPPTHRSSDGVLP